MKSRKTPPAEQKVSAPAPAKLDPRNFEMHRGFGFRASLEDGFLQIEQDDDEGATAAITLSPTEFRVLAAQFEDWYELP